MMRTRTRTAALALALCFLAAAGAAAGEQPQQQARPEAAGGGAAEGRTRRSSEAAERLLAILAEYARGAGAGGSERRGGADGTPRVYAIDLPIDALGRLGNKEGARGGGGGGVPVLVLSVPRAAHDGAEPGRDRHGDGGGGRGYGGGGGGDGARPIGFLPPHLHARDEARDRTPPRRTLHPSRDRARYRPIERNIEAQPERAPHGDAPYGEAAHGDAPQTRYREVVVHLPARTPAPAPEPRRRRPEHAPEPRPRYGHDQPLDDDDDRPVSSARLLELFEQQEPRAPHLPPAVLDDPPRPRSRSRSRGRQEPLPTVSVSSLELVTLYRAQTPSAPHMPPALLHPGLRPAAQPPRAYLPAPGPAPRTPPPAPRFDRSMSLRARLTVRHADYTEPYTVRWDAASGAARVDFHDQGTFTVRRATADGRVQRVEVRTDRTGARELVRCGVAQPLPATPEDRAPPALPDLALFTFAGHMSEAAGADGAGEAGSRVERWTRTVSGAAGELGAARGERLTVRHEALVSVRAGRATPLRYTVAVDSSVLGADCEGYEHHYERLTHEEHAPEEFHVDLERVCEAHEALDAARPEHLARLEPLREFTLPARDGRYDAVLDGFVEQFERRYADDTEEAVRKALVVQHSRFVSSCNRQDATFELELNFLGDRLDVELELLLGARYDDAAAQGGARFPYEREAGRELAAALPDEFDWRPLGAVTGVRYQESCSSCWAFATVGSVEGALFVRTRRLVPLSEQCLVDCAHSHGAGGCRGTWPSKAFDYVAERGLPARDAYTPYRAKVLACRDERVPPVTYVSGHVNVTPNDTDALKVAIRREAPTIVVIDSRPHSFAFYKKGVLMDERCVKGPKNKLNHAVLAVGWGQQDGDAHFILKNSYSSAWGEGGFVRVRARANTCGVLTVPHYALLRDQDVADLPPAAPAPAPAPARGRRGTRGDRDL